MTQSEPGVVTQVTPLLVRLDSADTATSALKLASYTPVLNDQVAVVRQGSQLLILGKVA